MSRFKIAYYGPDDRLKVNILKEEKSFLRDGCSITFDYITSVHNHTSLCDLILKNEHDLYLVDFTLGEELIKALYSLFFEIKIKNITIIGLWTQLDHEKLQRYKSETGVQTHFTYATNDPSSASDLLISLSKYLGINTEKSNFFKKKIDSEKYIKQPFRLKYLGADKLSLETDAIFAKNRGISIELDAAPNFPYKDFRVLDISQSKIIFNYAFRYTLDYFFLDKKQKPIYSSEERFSPQDYLKIRVSEFQDDGELDEKDVLAFLKDYQEILLEKNRRRTYVKKNIDKHNEKSVDDHLRVLIIDKVLTATFRTATRPIWSYPYRFFLLSDLQNKSSIVDAVGAHIITVQLETFDSVVSFTKSEMFKQFKFIIDTLREIAQLDTQIILFNSPGETEEIYPLFNYENLIALKTPYSFELLLNNIRSYAEERERKVGHQYFKLDPNTLYPSIFSEFSNGSISTVVHVEHLSESEMSFTTQLDLVMHSSFVFETKSGLKINLTIYKKEKYQDGYRYISLVHSLDEVEKKSLRRYLNIEE